MKTGKNLCLKLSLHRQEPVIGEMIMKVTCSQFTPEAVTMTMAGVLIALPRNLQMSLRKVIYAGMLLLLITEKYCMPAHPMRW